VLVLWLAGVAVPSMVNVAPEVIGKRVVLPLVTDIVIVLAIVAALPYWSSACTSATKVPPFRW
jgi:hypothetical protein